MVWCGDPSFVENSKKRMKKRKKKKEKEISGKVKSDAKAELNPLCLLHFPFFS